MKPHSLWLLATVLAEDGMETALAIATVWATTHRQNARGSRRRFLRWLADAEGHLGRSVGWPDMVFERSTGLAP